MIYRYNRPYQIIPSPIHPPEVKVYNVISNFELLKQYMVLCNQHVCPHYCTPEYASFLLKTSINFAIHLNNLNIIPDFIDAPN